jgi:serine/threonine protein kinase
LDHGPPQAKIIDFGIARAIAQPLGDKAVSMDFRALIGTPAYMSPEQTWPERENVDARSDVYSLGVVLYELLVGCRPFDFNVGPETGLERVLKTIREVQPPKPSARLSALSQDALQTLFRKYNQSHADLLRGLRGDLDSIVMKCLEKNRSLRYQSAADLALDLDRHLKGGPVAAEPRGLFSGLRKFIRQNCGRGSLAGVMLLSTCFSSLVIRFAGGFRINE